MRTSGLRHLFPLISFLCLPLGCGSADEPAGADAGLTADANASLGEAPACEFDDEITYSLLAETLQLRGADSSDCMVIERASQCPAGEDCKAIPFEWSSLVVSADGVEESISSTEALTWTSSHHNWQDSGIALGETRKYVLQSTFTEDFEDTYSLHIYDKATDELLVGPLELVPYAP